MHKNDSTNVKKSILIECGLKVKKNCIEEVVSGLFTLALRELEKELSENYSITDILNRQKGAEIINIHTKYFVLDEYYSGYIIYSSNFMSSMVLNKNWIKENKVRLKEVFAAYLEDDGLTAKDIKQIPEAFHVFLAKESCISKQDIGLDIWSIHYGSMDPFRDYCNHAKLANNVKVRTKLGVWEEVKATDLVTFAIRKEIYEKVILRLKQFNYAIEQRANHYYVQKQQDMYRNLLLLFKWVEETKFETNWEEMLSSLPTISDITNGRITQ